MSNVSPSHKKRLSTREREMDKTPLLTSVLRSLVCVYTKYTVLCIQTYVVFLVLVLKNLLGLVVFC